MNNYSGHEWKGTNYDSNLGIKDIAKLVRQELKKTGCKFSITKESFSGGCALNIALREAPFEVFIEKKEYEQVNHYHIDNNDNFTDKAKELLKHAVKVVNSYNRDDSDSMIDYFDCNFYSHFSVGSWDRPFKVVI